MEQISLYGSPEPKIKPANSNYGITGISSHGKIRETNDFYATDPIAAEWLCKLEHLNDDIWECACGDGKLSEVFELAGYNVRSTDLIFRGYGEGGVDFLKQSEPWHGDIITNPPFKYAQEFVEKALELVPEGNKVIMFLKLQFLEGKNRRRLFEQQPPKTIWVSSSRIQCSNNGIFKGSMLAFAWYVWQKGYKGSTEIKWFN